MIARVSLRTLFLGLVGLAAGLPAASPALAQVRGGRLIQTERPLAPPEGQAWLFYSRESSSVFEVLPLVRKVVADKGLALMEYDLGNPAYFRLLADIEAARGIPWKSDLVFMAGRRYLGGGRRVLEFLGGWAAGTEDLQPRSAVDDPEGVVPVKPLPLNVAATPPRAVPVQPARPVTKDAPAKEALVATSRPAASQALVLPPARPAGTVWGTFARFRYTLLLPAAVVAAFLAWRYSRRARSSSSRTR